MNRMGKVFQAVPNFRSEVEINIMEFRNVVDVMALETHSYISTMSQKCQNECWDYWRELNGGVTLLCMACMSNLWF